MDAEEIVDSYGGRSLYVIFNLINRLESMALNEREKLILHTLFLEVLDAGNPLHHIENTILRPRQLTVPGRYRELNLWLAFQQSIQHWKQANKKIECTQYPQFPVGAGICIYSGRAKDLSRFPDVPKFAQVITVFPRPNQAFWSLSAVWASWLLGREAAASMTQVIARHRYDWTWHTIALAGSLKAIPGLLQADAGFLGMIPEIEPAFLATVFHAMHLAGFQTRGISIRPENDLGQLSWSISSTQDSQENLNLATAVRQAAQSFLEEKGEPATYLEMTAVACLAIARNNAWPGDSTQTNLLQLMRAAFSNPILFNHYGSGEQTLESGFWCLRRLPSGTPNASGPDRRNGPISACPG